MKKAVTSRHRVIMTKMTTLTKLLATPQKRDGTTPTKTRMNTAMVKKNSTD